MCISCVSFLSMTFSRILFGGQHPKVLNQVEKNHKANLFSGVLMRKAGVCGARNSVVEERVAADQEARLSLNSGSDQASSCLSAKPC